MAPAPRRLARNADGTAEPTWNDPKRLPISHTPIPDSEVRLRRERRIPGFEALPPVLKKDRFVVRHHCEFDLFSARADRPVGALLHRGRLDPRRPKTVQERSRTRSLSRRRRRDDAIG